MIDFRHTTLSIRVLLFVCLSTTTLLSNAAPISQQLTTSERRSLQREARHVVDILQNHHYSGRGFRKIQNKEMLSRFIEELDPQAYFLTTEDVRYIHSRFDRTLKTVYLFRGELRPAFEVFDLFSHRAQERIAWIKERLTRGFDLTIESNFQEPEEFQPTQAGADSDQQWELRLKDQLISEIIAGRSEAEARTHLAERYAKTKRQITAFDPFAIRERFFDAIIRSFDPHSGYFSGDSTREFEIDMKNSVIGIGLDLRKEGGQCVVAVVQPGSPADLHSDLATGDTIIALAEGENPLVTTTNMRLREIVAKLRGTEGEPIRLCYQSTGSDHQVEVTLKRERVLLASGRASGAISDVKDNSGQVRKIGWITLPDFYAGGEGEYISSVANDVEELLVQMIASNIEGLTIDLRRNPGGALNEAVAVSQLFVPCGNMMLSRGRDGALVQHVLDAESPVYTGPLVVLISERSASASEIFSGAMKFHQRAVIVGSEHTYGKGTAQSYIALAKLPGINPERAKDWGTLRLTASQFFQPSGKPIQQQGVASDIIINTYVHPAFKQEKDLPHALPPLSVKPPESSPCPPYDASKVTPSLLKYLQDETTTNMRTLPEWELWRDEQNYQSTRWALEPRSLLQTDRENTWSRTLSEYQALQGTRRKLTANLVMPTQPIDTSSVKKIYQSHEDKLRAMEVDQKKPILHRLNHGRFYIQNDQGRLRGISLADLDPIYYYGDTSLLAEVLTQATGHPFTDSNVFQLLQTFSLLESKTQPALLKIVDDLTGNLIDAQSSRRGIEAMLRRMTELNPEMHRSRTGLDVPLRECLRLSAAWASYLESPTDT